jgi:hypothetical protein
MTVQELKTGYISSHLYDSRGNLSDRALEELRAGVCPFEDAYERTTKTFIQGNWGGPLDVPKVELRFRRPGPDGELIPAPVAVALGYPFRNRRVQESGEWEGPRMDCRMRNAYDHAHAARFLLSDSPDAGEFYSFVFGRTYYMRFYYPGYAGASTPDLWGSALVRMPKHVPNGKVAVIVLDVTKRAEGWRKALAAEREKRESVTVRVRKNPAGLPLGAYLYDTGRGFTRFAQLGGDLETEFKVHGLGGELTVDALVKPDITYTLYYKRQVNSHAVTFPDDADVMVKPEAIIRFHLKVPEEKVPSESLGMALLMHRNSQVSVAGMEFAEVAGWSRSRNHDLPESVPILAAPGSYYVAHGFHRPEVIGTITVKKSDAGRTLEMRPLAD